MKVLFIAGYGRSGSTLLEQVLASDEAFVSLGEVKHLWLQGYMLDYLCGCGAEFHECPFWRQIDRLAFGGLPAATARKVFELRNNKYRWARLPVLLASAWRDRFLRRPAAPDEYSDRIRAVYRAALNSATGTVVIDSSKDPLHGLALARLDDVSLHVVHLVRDARGVAYSFFRPKLRRQVHYKTQYMKARAPRRTALVWSYRNVLAAALRPLAATYRLVRYENFVTKPDEVIAAVRADVGLPPTESVLRNGHRVLLPSTHSVSGNPLRFEDRDVELRLDDRWLSELPRPDRLAVTVLAAPLLLRYGYLLRGVADAARRVPSNRRSEVRHRR